MAVLSSVLASLMYELLKLATRKLAAEQEQG
jgi:hypothetical protein